MCPMNNGEAYQAIQRAVNSNNIQEIIEVSILLHNAEETGATFSPIVDDAWARLTLIVEQHKR